ncbi:DNA topoisomerase I [Marinobacterium sedimentorum]|uniref:DNA topoisomerase I n=1 Tax=Marinobacterium sedimentorum TaxID=2927804 RepID=UPI0020C5FD1A|nr:DNA topoisomerase I [Marinobacterium sedimentorum]MCP8689272.1 DNA topoisomerase I [Marinobacterium sedimentorum]
MALMLHDNIIILIIIAVVGLLALIGSHIISQRELHARRQTARVKWLGQQAEHGINALGILRACSCKPEIVERIEAHVAALISEMADLTPDNPLLSTLTSQKQHADRSTAAAAALNSDRAIKRASIFINYARDLLAEMAQNNSLSPALAKSYAQELHWLNVSIIATAHLTQGQKSLGLQDKPAALSHLKHAKAVLTRAMVPQQFKQERLTQIQTLLDSLEPRPQRSDGTLADNLDAYFKDH